VKVADWCPERPRRVTSAQTPTNVGNPSHVLPPRFAARSPAPASRPVPLRPLQPDSSSSPARPARASGGRRGGGRTRPAGSVKHAVASRERHAESRRGVRGFWKSGFSSFDFSAGLFWEPATRVTPQGTGLVPGIAKVPVPPPDFSQSARPSPGPLAGDSGLGTRRPPATRTTLTCWRGEGPHPDRGALALRNRGRYRGRSWVARGVAPAKHAPPSGHFRDTSGAHSRSLGVSPAQQHRSTDRENARMNSGVRDTERAGASSRGMPWAGFVVRRSIQLSYGRAL
jgi:hypothetical protein